MVCVVNLFYLLLLPVLNISAWSVPQINTKSRPKSTSTIRFLSDKWGEEDEEYDSAQKEIIKKQLIADLADEDFFEKPIEGSEEEQRRRIREVLRARAEANGIQKADMTKVKELQDRVAKQTLAARSGGFDLSEFTDEFEAPKITKKKEIDYEKEMTEEERREADPLGFEPIWKWFYEETKEIEWSGWKRTVEVGIKLAIFSKAGEYLLISSDARIEQFMLDVGKFPTKMDIDAARSQRLEMAKELANEATNPGNLNNLNLPPISPP